MASLLAISIILFVSTVTIFSDDVPEIPNIGRMTYGFDLSTLNMFPSTGSDEIRAVKPAISFTYSENKHWMHPSLKTTYKMPDQVASVNGIPMGNLDSTVTVSRTVSEHLHAISASVGIETSFPLCPGVDFSLNINAEYKNDIKTMVEKNQTAAELTAKLNSHVVGLKSAQLIEPSSSFQADVSRLKGTYEDNSDMYDSFINDYGSHYFATAYFGGTVRLSSLVSSSFDSSSDSTEIKLAFSLKFKTLTGGTGGHADMSESDKEALSKYESAASIKVLYYGGQISIENETLNEKHLREWESFIEQNPWQVGGQAKPIFDLIKNEDIKYEVKNAMYSRIAKGILDLSMTILNAIGLDDEFTIPTCNCKVKDVKRVINKNLKFKVPVRQEVRDVLLGLTKYASDRQLGIFP